MAECQADVVIVGGGFGGSLLSLSLQQQGLRCVLIDHASHPRFAIGESSTPLADFVLSSLATRYNLPRIRPLAAWGTWRTHRPDLACGPKRGFSYFGHTADQSFRSGPGHQNQLLVGASAEEADSDTHWFRSDVDAFLFREAADAGVDCREDTEVTAINGTEPWRLETRCQGVSRQITARFLVDASGTGGGLLRHLRVGPHQEPLQTRSRAVFGHFRGVERFADVLTECGVSTAPHPFPCDDAALHHVLENGWMWNLRFCNGVVSAGFLTRLHGDDEASGPDAAVEWSATLQRYPSLARQFRHAEPDPMIGLRQTGRLQRLAAAAAGPGWAALPHTVGFVDPLHSTGIAHTLSAVERLADALTSSSSPPLHADWADYDRAVVSELQFIDELVAGCYLALPDFRLFSAWAMLYFAAATTCERRRVEGEACFAGGFLCAGDTALRRLVAELRRKLNQVLNGSRQSDWFEAEVRAALRPFNHVGLCDPQAENMYRATAPPRGFGGV